MMKVKVEDRPSRLTPELSLVHRPSSGTTTDRLDEIEESQLCVFLCFAIITVLKSSDRKSVV